MKKFINVLFVAIIAIFTVSLTNNASAAYAETDENLSDIGTAVVAWDYEIPVYGAQTDLDILFWLPANQTLEILDATETRYQVRATAGTASTIVWIDKDPLKTWLGDDGYIPPLPETTESDDEIAERIGTPICMSIRENLVYSSTESDAAVMLIPYGTPYFMLDEVNGMIRVIIPFGDSCIEGFVYRHAQALTDGFVYNHSAAIA